MADNTEIAVKEETQVAQKTEHVNKISISNEIYGSSDDFDNAYRMASAMAKSTIVPQIYQQNTANCMLAVAQAKKFGVDPITVANNLYPIQGRPSWKSEFLIAMINNSGKFDIELQYDEKTDKDGKPFSCTCWTTKDGRKLTGITVDMNMAEAEGWTKKNGSKWRTMSQVMLRYRAATFFARFNCPELTSGMYTKEEFDDNDFEKKPKKASLNDLLESDDVLVGEVIDES